MKEINFESYKLSFLTIVIYESWNWIYLTDVNLASDNCEVSLLTQYIIKNQNNKIYVHLFIHFVNL